MHVHLGRRSPTTPPASKYAVEKLGVKKASVIYTDDTQGKFTGLGRDRAALLKAQGVDVKTVPLAPNAADLSSVAASAIENQPDMVYVNSPNACPGVLKALQSVGNTAKIFGIDPCTSPPALKTAGDAAEGLYFAQPFDSLDSGSDDTNVMVAAMQKYGEKNVALDSIAQAGFNSVMNMQDGAERGQGPQHGRDPGGVQGQLRSSRTSWRTRTRATASRSPGATLRSATPSRR